MPDESLFLFIKILDEGDTESHHLNLGTLLGFWKEMDKEKKSQEFLEQLLRMQSKSLGKFFFEKLKGNDSVQMAKERLPDFL